MNLGGKNLILIKLVIMGKKLSDISLWFCPGCPVVKTLFPL